MRLIFALLAVVACMVSCTIGGDSDDDYGKGLLEKGTPAPDFTISSGEGQGTLTLGSLRGRYVLIEFWASWCPDCRKVTQDMCSIYREYSPAGLVMLGVSFDDDEAEWRAYIEENGMGWLQHREEKPRSESQLAGSYNIRWIPTLYLIDPEGRVDFATVDVGEMRDTLAARRFSVAG